MKKNNTKKIHDEENINILNKDGINITNFSFGLRLWLQYGITLFVKITRQTQEIMKNNKWLLL